MRFLKLTGLLMFLSMLAVGCSSDDDEKDVVGGEAAELYVYVRDASDNYLLEGVDVEFVQNNKLLCIDTTDDSGAALCNNKYDGLVSGMVTVNINVEGYKPFTKTGNVTAGDNEWEVSLIPDASAASSITVTSEVEDLYGMLSIDMPKDVAYVRVSEGNKYDVNDYDEYKNTSLGYGSMTQKVTYTNLIPETKYTFTVVSFASKNKQLETKTVSFTTKELYNRSSAEASAKDFMALSNGISVELTSHTNAYFVCYEMGKVPSDDKRIIKDALSTSEIQKNMTTGYAYGLQPGTQYRIFVIPVMEKAFELSSYHFTCNVPGTVSYMDVTTKKATEKAAAVPERVASDKNSLTYRFRKMDGCNSFRAVTLPKYDQYEDLPDIALAILCLQKGELNKFDIYTTPSYSSEFYWSGLDLTSWYGICSLGYTDTQGGNNSGIISRYKFKYGSYGVKTRSAEALAPVPTSGIKYGCITDEMLKHVRVLK